MDVAGTLAEAGEERMDLVARLDKEALTRSMALIDVASSLEESNKASKRSMALIDAEAAEGIDRDMADSTERLNISRIRRLSLEAESMGCSSVSGLRAIGPGPQLSHSSGYVPQRRMSKEDTSAAAD